MPKFFDKKEEVLDIELTQYGKHLLSMGKFKPHYYAFYDDDVLYDSNYAGYEEKQNEAQQRILENTPFMKSQPTRYCIEDQVKEAVEHIRSENLVSEFIPQTQEKAHASSVPMGTTEYNTNFAPSWQVRVLEGEINSSSTHLTGTYENISVPQLEMKSPEYKIKLNTGGTPGDEESCEIYNPNDEPAPVGPDLNIVSDENITSKVYPDGTFLTIDSNNISLQIDELNSIYSSENFEIEMFVVEENSGTEKLIPLSFIKQPEQIVNGILLDPVEYQNVEPGPNNVEYYFDIFTDHDLPDDFWKSSGATARKSDVFYNEEDFEINDGPDRDIAIQNLYDSNNDGPFGEEC